VSLPGSFFTPDLLSGTRLKFYKGSYKKNSAAANLNFALINSDQQLLCFHDIKDTIGQARPTRLVLDNSITMR
jgi:hypothetical protein